MDSQSQLKSSILDLLASGRPVHSIEMSALHIGAGVCSCISLLCLLLALGSDYWIADSGLHIGLWKYCEHELCDSLGVEGVSASFHAIRTFMFLGMIAGAVSLGGLCTMNRQPSLGNISMSWITYIASFTAGLCVMIAMSIFSGGIGSTKLYGWSFGLGWASFPLFFITGWLTYKLHKNRASTA
ncbi:lens fiber membrane intrinsic protein-like isoform X1 [Pituophis catenifer annectens]|uniref:lens fiber membrane intrinsic protein-like isoform X1 n=2 Tax=Pituophis catenifer annectens TaxID=94852 RepID=UPI0039957BAC